MNYELDKILVNFLAPFIGVMISFSPETITNGIFNNLIFSSFKIKFKSSSSSSFDMLFLKNFDIMFSMFLLITNLITVPEKLTLLKLKKI